LCRGLEALRNLEALRFPSVQGNACAITTIFHRFLTNCINLC
jgi:hypothetical protein